MIFTLMYLERVLTGDILSYGWHDTYLTDLVPHLVVGHDAKAGETLVISRQLQLPGEMFVQEVVLEAVEPEELRTV